MTKFKAIVRLSCITTAILLTCSASIFGMTTPPMTFPQYITAWGVYDKSVKTGVTNIGPLQSLLADLNTVPKPNAGALRFLAGKLGVANEKSAVLAELQRLTSASPAPTVPAPAPTVPAPAPVPAPKPAAPAPKPAPIVPALTPTVPAPKPAPVALTEDQKRSLDDHRDLVAKLKDSSVKNSTKNWAKVSLKASLRNNLDDYLIDYLVKELTAGNLSASLLSKEDKLAAIEDALVVMGEFPIDADVHPDL